MIVGSMYENMSCFRLALATHAIRNEFEFNIEKSDPGRYRVSAKIDGCRWRILASTGADKTTVKVTLAILLFC
jgi:predicted aspartyl protease